MLDAVGAASEQPDGPLRTSAGHHWRGPQRVSGPTDELSDVVHVREGLHPSKQISEPRIMLDADRAASEQVGGPVRRSTDQHSPLRSNPDCIAKPSLERRTFPRRRHNAQEPKQKDSGGPAEAAPLAVGEPL
jgi:hypothetical protein